MVKVFDSKHDCPELEALLWDVVSQSYGDFEGIKEIDKTQAMMIMIAAQARALREENGNE